MESKDSKPMIMNEYTDQTVTSDNFHNGESDFQPISIGSNKTHEANLETKQAFHEDIFPQDE